MTSRFPDPDIDPALTVEAQAVVSDATASMKQWLNKSFTDIEASIEVEIDKASKEVESLAAGFTEVDEKRTAEIKQSLAKLDEIAQNLTPLDEDQRQLLEELGAASKAVKEELTARTERWQGIGTKAVQVMKVAVKSATGGLV
jgi:hypothetical protein